MEVVCWRGRIGDLNIIACGELQVPLRSGRRVFRALPFQAVWNEENQPRWLQPLLFAAHDELVDHDLRPIGEVAELGFPDRQRLRPFEAVAIFEAEYPILR